MLSTLYIFFSFISHSTLIDRFYYISENLRSISMVHHKRWQNQDLNSGRVCDSNTHALNHQVILPHNYTISGCLGTQQLSKKGYEFYQEGWRLGNKERRERSRENKK